MALTSASTLTDALAQYNNNLAWEGNATKATDALEAIRWLLVNRAQTIGEAGVNLNYAGLEQEKERLKAYVATVGAASSRAPFTQGRANLW